MSLEHTIFDLLQPTIIQLGYELVEVIYKKENSDMVLRIVIDKEEPIGLQDVVLVSENVSNILDEKNVIDNKYMLDVTSLGVEKPIKIEHFEKYTGKYIYVKLLNPKEGQDHYEGYLTEVNNNDIAVSYMIKTRKKVIVLQKDNIERARLAIKF